MTDLYHGWKILTHDGRSPLQGGPSIVNGSFPLTLPTVPLDTGPAECAAGWNYVAEIATGWRIAGIWPTGRPSRIIAVEAGADAIQRGDKRRASSLTLLREATAGELRTAFDEVSRPFGAHQARMAQEQAAWYQALRCPHQDAGEVDAQLVLALSDRGLPWSLKRFPTARAAWAAWDAWATWDARAAWAARAARATWDAWATWDARAAWAARAARATWDVRAAWDARAAWATCWDVRATWDARAAWAAWAAWDAWAALTTLYARLMGWQDGEPDQYTVGIREAYRHGLAIALPVGPSTLGWAMEERP